MSAIAFLSRRRRQDLEAQIAQLQADLAAAIADNDSLQMSIESARSEIGTQRRQLADKLDTVPRSETIGMAHRIEQLEHHLAERTRAIHNDNHTEPAATWTACPAAVCGETRSLLPGGVAP